MAFEYSEKFITNVRGQQLFTVRYVPKENNVIAFLAFHHGYGEHVGRYSHVFGKLAEAGIAVASYDAHSHGRSEPAERALVWDYTDLVDDFHQFIVQERERTPLSSNIPVFIGGQSAGGLVAAHLAVREPRSFAGLLLFSALIDVEWNLTLRLLAPLGSFLAVALPKARVAPAVRCEDMSQDPEVVKHYKEDPLNFVGPVRARTANELLKGMNALAKAKHQLKLPLLAVHGSTDRCTSLKAVKQLLDSAASTDKTLREIPGGFHELLVGPEKDDVVQIAVAWITSHLPSKL